MKPIPPPQPFDLIVIAPITKPNSGIDFREHLARAEAQVKVAEAGAKTLHALQIAQRHLACIETHRVATTTISAARRLAEIAIIEAGGDL